jgi:plastocyanin
MRRSRRTGATALVVAAVLGLVVVGCSSSSNKSSNQSSANSTGAVNATDSRLFSPESVTVSSGGTVKWTNTGQLPHTVTFDSGPAFDQQLPAGQTVSRTFTTAGTFTYHCSIHGPTMHGTIIVK